MIKYSDIGAIQQILSESRVVMCILTFVRVYAVLDHKYIELEFVFRTILLWEKSNNNETNNIAKKQWMNERDDKKTGFIQRFWANIFDWLANMCKLTENRLNTVFWLIPKSNLLLLFNFMVIDISVLFPTGHLNGTIHKKFNAIYLGDFKMYIQRDVHLLTYYVHR